MSGLSDNDVFSSDILDDGGDQTALTVGVTAVEGKVGASARSNRKYVVFQAKDNGIYFGYTAGVTTANGIEIFRDQLLMMPIGQSTTIYFIATGAGKEVRFQELS